MLQAFANLMNTQNRHNNGQAGKGRDPPRGGEKGFAVIDDRTPTCGGRLHAEAEKAQRRLD